jgi:hypothetical protein
MGRTDTTYTVGANPVDQAASSTAPSGNPVTNDGRGSYADPTSLPAGGDAKFAPAGFWLNSDGNYVRNSDGKVFCGPGNYEGCISATDPEHPLTNNPEGGIGSRTGAAKDAGGQFSDWESILSDLSGKNASHTLSEAPDGYFNPGDVEHPVGDPISLGIVVLASGVALVINGSVANGSKRFWNWIRGRGGDFESQ